MAAVAIRDAPRRTWGVAPDGRRASVPSWPLFALAPLVAVLVLRLPLVNQLDYADAWFYSAYAWVPKHHVDVFGLNYFAVRFPAVLSIGAFAQVFGTHAGYLILRYLLAVATAVALFAGVRRFASRPVALATVVALFANPLFGRMLLWDYVSFLAVPAGIAGLALWYWAEDRPLVWTLLPGLALATMVFAYGTSMTVLVAWFVVEAVAALRLGRGAVLRLARRLGVCLAAALAVYLVGYVSYAALLGVSSPYELLRPIVEFLGDAEGRAAQFVFALREWLLHDPRVWAPVVLCVALVVALGRGFLGTGVAARCAQTAVVYVALLWLMRFAVTSSTIETWWAYNLVVIPLAPATGVLLTALTRRRALLVGGALALLLTLALRNLPGPADDAYVWLADRPLLVALAAVLALAAALVTTRAASLALLPLLALLVWAPSAVDPRDTTGAFTSTQGGTEWDAYGAGRSVAELIRAHESGGRRVYLWYRGVQGLTNVAWVDLPQYGQTVHVLGEPGRYDVLDDFGVARLSEPAASSVLVLSTAAADLAASRAALTARGFAGAAEPPGTLAGGALHYQLTELTQKP